MKAWHWQTKIYTIWGCFPIWAPLYIIDDNGLNNYEFTIHAMFSFLRIFFKHLLCIFLCDKKNKVDPLPRDHDLNKAESTLSVKASRQIVVKSGFHKRSQNEWKFTERRRLNSNQNISLEHSAKMVRIGALIQNGESKVGLHRQWHTSFPCFNHSVLTVISILK